MVMGIGETRTSARLRTLVQKEHTRRLKKNNSEHVRAAHCKIQGIISPVKRADRSRVSPKMAGGVKIAKKTTRQRPTSANVAVNASCKKGGVGVIDANTL